MMTDIVKPSGIYCAFRRPPEIYYLYLCALSFHLCDLCVNALDVY